jgi:sec-independent protein translocase protein TatA
MNTLLIPMFGIGMQEILLLGLLVLLFFGGKKIPELMKGLGKGVKSFKDGINGIDGENDNNAKNTGDEK